MTKKSPCCVILLALVILSLPSSEVFAQGKLSSQSAAAPQASSRNGDPELAAIDKAEREGRMADAEKLLAAGIKTAEAGSGPRERLSMMLNRLAWLETSLGHRAKAAAAATQALELDKKLFGPESTAVVRDLDNLALFDEPGRRDKDTENYLKQAVEIARQNPGPGSQTLLGALINLGMFYTGHNRGAEAVPLMREGLRLCRNGPVPKPLSCGSFRGTLARAYREEGRAGAAESLAVDAAAADLSPGTPWHKRVADLDNLALQYEEDKSYDLAETARRQAAALIEKNAKPQDAVTLLPNELDLLGNVLVEEGRNAEAEELFNRALAITERAARAGRLDLAGSLPFAASFLGSLYRSEGRTTDMERLAEKVLAVQEQVLGPMSPQLALALDELVLLKAREADYSGAAPLCE